MNDQAVLQSNEKSRISKAHFLITRQQVDELWPELAWIESPYLRDAVANTWLLALDRSPLTIDDLKKIPFTLLIPNCKTTFIEHKRCVVHIAKDAAHSMQVFMGNVLRIDMDTVVAGAILADVGKLLEYELKDGKAVQSERGELLRHPFTGVVLATECGVSEAVCHIIAAHAAEGELVQRTTEAFIVHHADFMAYLPFKNPNNLKK
ncbi:MAG TPA: HD domain-containing protein [Candidatus Koribacter sp.]|jgi:putative nucleotidyltransferase with HDIG domain